MLHKNRHNVLLVEVGPYEFKHQFIERMINSGFNILVLKHAGFSNERVNWHSQYFERKHIIEADITNYTETQATVKKYLAFNNIRLKGVITYLEEAVLLTQYIATSIGLPQITYEDVKNLRNKAAMRKALTAAELPQPKFAICRNLQEAKNAVKAIGVPCIVKPVELLASLGVNKVSSFDGHEIEKAYLDALDADISDEELKKTFRLSSDVIIEEYIPTTQEISVEGLVFNGNLKIISITKKYLDTDSFQEIGHLTPFKIAQSDYDDVKSALLKASDQLQLANTIFHAEFRLRDGKPPILIEIGARLAGDLIPILVEESSGVDMITGSLFVASDIPYDFEKKTSRHAAIEFFRDRKIWDKRNELLPLVQKLPCVRDISFYVNPIEDRARFGHIIWIGNDPKEMNNNRKKIWEIITPMLST